MHYMFIVLMVVNKFVVTEVYTLFPLTEFNTVQRLFESLILRLIVAFYVRDFMVEGILTF